MPLGDSGQSSTTDEGPSKRLVKRIAEDELSELSDKTLYVSIEGQQDFSSFVLETTFGNTCKLLSYFIKVCIRLKKLCTYSWSSNTSNFCGIAFIIAHINFYAIMLVV